MAESLSTSQKKRHYFVDEAGDPVLFSRRKRVVVGTPGCSRYFILGLLDVSSPDTLADELQDLRKRLLADPYFKGVPSMQPEQNKTSRAFHAKDDIPEVRREVFQLLTRHELRFFAVVRDKRRIADLVLAHNRSHPQYRYHPNQLYDRCVSRLFKERLHKDAAYRIVFAKRGAADRTAALEKALTTARGNLRRTWGIAAAAPIEVVAETPERDANLQATDYFLWALQRLYEKREDRYWQFVWPSVRLVWDVDDTRRNSYGEYYTRRNALRLDVLQE
jgi:hypothetical protein